MWCIRQCRDTFFGRCGFQSLRDKCNDTSQMYFRNTHSPCLALDIRWYRCNCSKRLILSHRRMFLVERLDVDWQLRLYCHFQLVEFSQRLCYPPSIYMIRLDFRNHLGRFVRFQYFHIHWYLEGIHQKVLGIHFLYWVTRSFSSINLTWWDVHYSTDVYFNVIVHAIQICLGLFLVHMIYW